MAAKSPVRSKSATDLPKHVLEASRTKYAEQQHAGKRLEYGAVGDWDYRVDGLVWLDPKACQDGTNPYFQYERQPLFTVSQILDVLESVRGEAPLRVLDLGTGNGKTLALLHETRHIPWENILGVTAEDMRGRVVLESEEGFDPGCPDSSYLIGNLEELERLPGGQQFDLALSWVTFCWLADPLGALCRVYNNFLAPGGTMVVGGVSLLSEDKECSLDEERILLFAWAQYMRDHCGCQIELLQDALNGVYVWWVQRKPPYAAKAIKAALPDSGPATQCSPMELRPCLEYGSVDEDSNKVRYRVTTSPEFARCREKVLAKYTTALPSGREEVTLPCTRVRDFDTVDLASLPQETSTKFERQLPDYWARRDVDVVEWLRRSFSDDLPPK